MGEERRIAPGIDFRLEVEIGSPEGRAKFMDFSTKGLFIQTDNPAPVKPGDEIELIMKLPLEELEQETMIIPAQVVRVTIKGIGVKFGDLWPAQIDAIRYCFNIFKNTVPLPGT